MSTKAKKDEKNQKEEVSKWNKMNFIEAVHYRILLCLFVPVNPTSSTYHYAVQWTRHAKMLYSFSNFL